MRRVVSLVAIAAVVAVFATPTLARTVSEVIPLGGTATGSVPADGASTVGVLIPEGALKVTISVKLDRKSGLDPIFSVFAPDGSEIDPTNGGSLKITSKKITVKNLPVGESGLYKFVLRGRAGSAGDYVLKCRGKTPKVPKVAGTIDDGAETDEYLFAVPDGASLTVKLSPAKKSALVPALTVLTASGIELDTSDYQSTRGAKVSLKKAPLPFFGGYVLRVSSKEGTGAYSLSVKVKVKKPKDDPSRPTADAGGVVVVPPGGAVGIKTSSTAGSRLQWTRVSGKGDPLSGPAATPTFTAPADGGTHAFQLVAEVDGVFSPADTAVIEVDQRPIAVGGASRTVTAGAEVTLDGSESFDLDSDEDVTFAWRQVEGTSVTLTGAASAGPSFTAPAAEGILVFELVVSDGFADSIADRVVIGVGRDVADAGRPVVVSPDDSVYLSGLRTPGTPDTFAWSRIDANPDSITLAGADRPVAGFSAPRSPGTYRFRLAVDGETAGADEVIVLVTSMVANGEPRAAAGGIVPAGGGQAFELSGTASADPEDDGLRYEWRQVDSRRVTLTGTGATRSGTAPAVASVLRFFLMVHDGRKYGPPDQATRVVGSPIVPVADAGGDDAGKPGDTISLDGSGSTASAGRTVTIRRWEQVTGLDLYDVAVESASFDPTAESPSFTVPETGISSLTPDRSILFALTVTDDEDAQSAPDFVVVTFNDLPGNAAPDVTAAPSVNRARPGTLITLAGTATDRDGDPLSYLWTQTSGPVTVSLSGATTLSASFTAPATSGRYIFRLAVTDGTGSPNATTTADVGVEANVAPVLSAIANPPAAPQGAGVTLDGSGTTDADGDTLTYFWQEVPTAGNPVVAILGQMTSKGTFTVLPYVGRTIIQRTRTYRLTVTDAMGPTSTTVNFVPNAVPGVGGVVPGKWKIRYDGTDSSSLGIGGLLDPDGDPLTISWRIVTGPSAQGATLAAATGLNSALTVAMPTSATPSTGGLWTVGATVTDGVQSAPEQTVQILAYPSWSKDAWGILSTSCATSGCHGSPTSSAGSILYMGSTAATAYGNLVGVASSGSSNKRVAPNDHQKSYLWKQVNSGTMPKFGSKLAAWQINIIRDWIEPEGLGTSGTLSGGAENN